MGKLENANELSIAFKSENENSAMLSSSGDVLNWTRKLFQIQINGGKLNESVRKTQSTKEQTKEDEKEETDLN